MKPQCEVFANTHSPEVFGFAMDDGAVGQIAIDRQMPISRIRMDNLRIYHPQVDQVSGSLTSPQGTNIQLFERPLVLGECDNETFLMQFDDEALLTPAQFVSLCHEPTLFDVNQAVQPIDPFASFAGEIAAGNWELFLSNQEVEGGVGVLEQWKLEVCFDTLLGEASHRSVDLQMPIGTEEVITVNQLETTLPGTELRDIIYILTEIPAFGELILNDQVLEVGSTFNQFDINQGRLSYRHAGATDVLLDDLVFNIHFPDDLWWPNRSLNILLDTPEPTWEVLVSNDSTCSVTLDVVVATPDFGPYSYSLDSSSFQSSPTFTGLSSGSFTVYLNYGNDQISSLTVEAKTLTASYHLDDKDIEVMAKGGMAPYTYQLDDGPEQSFSSFNAVPSGPHQITVRDVVGCSFVFSVEVPFSVSEETVDFPLPPFQPGASEQQPFYGPNLPGDYSLSKEGWTLFPNPSEGLIYLDWQDQQILPGDELWIMNSSGQSIVKKTLAGDRDHLSLDLSGLPVGVYRIFLKQSEALSVQEIVIYR